MKRVPMENIRFELYEKHHAAAVASMWSESREGWPPGFLGASDFTADSIEMEENSSGKLFTVLAVEGARVVGYCRTTPYGGEPDAAYVALINVVPDLHGRKLGKKLLLDAVARTAERGYYRIDLHTWAANLKAMPLYKKTGFFWVPDTMVYMQNYMPFLLGRPEFREFLGDTDWYDCFCRKLEVEPDEEKTISGREVFTYFFETGERSFKAEFDRRGRILSSIDSPDCSYSMERDDGKIYFGQPVKVSVTGDSLPDELKIHAHRYLSAPAEISADEISDIFDVIPKPVEVPIPDRDRSPRVSTTLPGKAPLEIGIGIRAEEPVSILSSPVRRISPGQKTLALDVRKLKDADSFRMEAGLNGKAFFSETFQLKSSIFQQVQIPLPELSSGLNELSLILFLDGQPGAEERIILVSGSPAGLPKCAMTRSKAVIVGKDITIAVTKMGAWGTLWYPGSGDREKRVGTVRISAGPPYWNSDLPHQIYSMALQEDQISAETSWPSRPGLKYRIRYRMDTAGYIEVQSSVINESASDQKVNFIGNWSGGFPFVAGTCIIPLKKGLFIDREVYNQVPDSAEDYPKNVSELGAPWLAVSNEDKSFMVWFPGWDKLQYGRPETEELTASPGETMESPAFCALLLRGGLKDILSDCRILGWNTGSNLKQIGFIEHNIEPVLGEGHEVILSHNLLSIE